MLITLGIIGVVASITIPSLTAKYQQKALVVQFKKSYSNFQNTVNRLSIERGGVYECFLENKSGVDIPVSSSECAVFWKDLLNEFKIINTCGYKNYKGNLNACRPEYKTKQQVLAEGGTQKGAACNFPIEEMTAYTLTDGSIIYVYDYPDYNNNSVRFSIDVNGMKGPNKWGYDLFYLALHKQNTNSLVNSKTYWCELIEKGGQSVEEIMLK